MKALAIYAGRQAREHLLRQGLQPDDVQTVAAAAGGPKGLILGPLDRFIFGHWLKDSSTPVDLVGASIGACRMATACMPDPLAAFQQFEHDYIAQDYPIKPGQRRPSAEQVSALFGNTLQSVYGAQVQHIVRHARYRLHILTAQGRGLLAHDQGWRTLAGFAQAYVYNLHDRRDLGRSFHRVVFSGSTGAGVAPLPFDVDDFPSQQVALNDDNFLAALQASCTIPFVMRAIHDIAGAAPGAYWDGGLVDYHLHLAYQRGLVLYPHFQQSVIPGWLDKYLKTRHRSSDLLNHVVLLAPQPQWVAQLPLAKLPDRSDFNRFAQDVPMRQRLWKQAVSAAEQLADEWAQWLHHPDPARVQVL